MPAFSTRRCLPRPPNRLGRKGFTLIELMIVVAIIAILAVVAIPQLSKYMRSAKAAEAMQMLDLVKKGATSYYTIPRTKEGGSERIPCQFPTKIGSTPTGASCCVDQNDADNDERCDSKPKAWDNPTWSALKFQMTDQHYFQYEFDSSGTLNEAVFAATAYGDLDCDGVKSTFEMVVHGDPHATEAECDSVMSAGFFRDLETE